MISCWNSPKQDEQTLLKSFDLKMACQVCGRGKDQASVHLIVTAEFQFETIYSKQQPRPRLGQQLSKGKSSHQPSVGNRPRQESSQELPTGLPRSISC